MKTTITKWKKDIGFAVKEQKNIQFVKLALNLFQPWKVIHFYSLDAQNER